MNHCKTSLFIAALFASLVVLSTPNAWAATPSPSFTITATNATVSSDTSSGTGSSTFTLTSINGYTGSVRVLCASPAPPVGVTVPFCSGGFATGAAVPAQPPIALGANQVVTGTVSFYNAAAPCSNPCPVNLPRREGHGLAHGLALAGVLLFGLGLLRRRAPWLSMVLLALGSLAGVAGFSACGSKSVVTPGTYAYSISATDISTQASVATTIQVTVP